MSKMINQEFIDSVKFDGMSPMLIFVHGRILSYIQKVMDGMFVNLSELVAENFREQQILENIEKATTPEEVQVAIKGIKLINPKIVEFVTTEVAALNWTMMESTVIALEVLTTVMKSGMQYIDKIYNQKLNAVIYKEMDKKKSAIIKPFN